MPRGTIPAQDNALLAFATPLSAALTAAPVPLACTAAMATQLAGYLATYSTKLAAAQADATRGKSTIFAKNQAREILVAYLRVVIRQIQGASTVSDQQRTDLGLPVRHTPTHPAAPGVASDFKATLTGMGELDLSWKCTNPTGGTMYALYRAIDDGPDVYIGACGGKRYLDPIPAGSAKVTYKIQARRSTAAGAWATFVVQIGVSPGGTTTAKVDANAAAVKIAA